MCTNFQTHKKVGTNSKYRFVKKLKIDCTFKPLLIPPILGLAKSGGIQKTAVLGIVYNLQNPYLGLGIEMGGGIGRGGIEGDDCTT